MVDNNKKNVKDNFSKIFLNLRTILLTGEIKEESAKKFCEEILILEELDKKKPILVFIDSPGGSVDSGFSIFNMIRFVKAPVYTIGMGLVASAAALIYLSSRRERRFSLPFARYMLHQPLSGFKGVASEIEIYAREIDNIKREINNIIAEETKKSLEQVEKDTDRDFWLSAKDAKKYGIVGEIIKTRDDINKFIH